MFRKLFISFLLILFSLISKSQIPTNNPYKTKYGVKTHWTDSLKWADVTDVKTLDGLVNEEGRVDSLRLYEAMNTIFKQGGGVLYFGPGKYFLDFDVKLYNGVILRGATPQISEANDPAYYPLTEFIFPKYNPSFSEKGTPNSSAFKKIHSRTGNNIALVNLNLNRGRIYFSGEHISNILFFGIRSNNVAEPRSVFLADYKNKAWQRYPNPNTGNIHIIAHRAVVANCRINDAITDDFVMPDFLGNDGVLYEGNVIKFQFGYNYGIKLNNYLNGDTSNIELRDNHIRAYLADRVVSSFTGKLLSLNNKYVKLDCQNIIDSLNYYSNKTLENNRKMFSQEKHIKQGDTLRYSILKPSNYNPQKKYPLVLFFHGRGQAGIERDHLVHCTYIFTNGSIKDENEYFVIAPHLMKGDVFSTSFDSSATKPLELSVDLVKTLTKQYPIDTQRLTVWGISDGGAAAWESLVRFPQQFNQAILISSVRPIPKNKADALKGTKFILSGGTKDPSIPVKNFRNMVSALRTANMEIKYFEYPEVAHWSHLELLVDPEFLKILQSEK